MSVYKPFTTSDIIVTPFEVNKSFSFKGNELTGSNVSIDRYIGQNITSSLFISGSNPTGFITIQDKKLLYDSIKEVWNSVNVGDPFDHKVEVIESLLTTKSSGSKFFNDIILKYFYELTFVMVTGSVSLAPLSIPTNTIVADKVELDPNKVFTVVALKLNCEPITVVETLVPKVVVLTLLFAVVAASESIPTPVNVDINLTSEIVAVYPLVSNAVAFPKKFNVWGVIASDAPCFNVIEE